MDMSSRSVPPNNTKPDNAVDQNIQTKMFPKLASIFDKYFIP